MDQWVNLCRGNVAIQPTLYRCHDYPLLPLGGIKPTVGWEVFYMWIVWYDQIATSGYEYANDGRDIMLPSSHF